MALIALRVPSAAGSRAVVRAACRAWTHPAYSQAAAYNCALAWQDLAFDDYLVKDTNLSAITKMSNFNTNPRYASFKYGWTAYDCAVAYPYICQMRPEAFPCMPPPSPPSPPPSPPVPPSPPAPPSCEPPQRSPFGGGARLGGRHAACACTKCTRPLPYLLLNTDAASSRSALPGAPR